MSLVEEMKRKADFADSVYEMAQRCIANRVPMFYGNIYEGLIKKYEQEVRCLHRNMRNEE